MSRYRKTVSGFQIIRDYSNGDGEFLEDAYPILFGTEAEANARKAELEAGSDPSYYPQDPEGGNGLLFVIPVHFEYEDVNSKY